MDKLIELLKRLAREGFFGAVEIKMEAGKIVIVRKTENIKVT